MRLRSPLVCSLSLGLMALGIFVRGDGGAEPQVDFARDVQPLFKAHCLPCHSADEANGKLVLASYKSVMQGGRHGPVVIPGKSSQSLLVARILGQGGQERMPLGFAPLTDAQIRTIRDWIDQGAHGSAPGAGSETHWAYIKPTKPPVPVLNSSWIKTPVDAFVLSKLRSEKLSPAPEADRTTLIRRLSLDLTGLPPSPAEVDAFWADRSPNAYGKVVDRLLASPHFGERMALPWLDAARYADSNGFQQDGDNNQWVWRDWVVKAFNGDLPYDQFVVDQLAGDLLPNPTLDELVATGFNRNHMLNGEGGAIPEEQRNVICFDRVDVTSTTLLGLTMACCRCHDHKYDPFTQKDYYSLMAFFNNVPESGVPSGDGQYRIADPWIYAGSSEQMTRLKALKAVAASTSSRLDRLRQSAPFESALRAWKTEVEESAQEAKRAKLVYSPWKVSKEFRGASFDAAFKDSFAPETEKEPTGVVRPKLTDGQVHELTGDNTAFYFGRTVDSDKTCRLLFSFGSDDGIKVWFNGELIVSHKVTRGAAPDEELATVELHPGTNRLLIKVVNGGGIGGWYFRANGSRFQDSVLALVSKSSLSPEELERLRNAFLDDSPPSGWREAKAQAEAATDAVKKFEALLPRAMVMSDGQPRTTHVLSRGNYEAPLDEVHPRTPTVLPPEPKGVPANRLGLAQWIVSPDNPLTARVEVNRVWQMLFGTGLVKTSENFGVQGEPPSHPELLDWLAVDFREKGWDVKRLVKMIVMSSTYRQSSQCTPELRERDPENRLLARGARFRLSSFFIRDVALASSGLLNTKVGGKPVYPYQPKDIWDSLSITEERDFSYPQSKGADLYRRSLYTFWRRTVAPGNMFDAASRQVCTVRPVTTSTPMHALTTLNDVTWVEAGRVLAQHVMKDAGPTPERRLAEAFRRVCARRPGADELKILVEAFTRSYQTYKAHPDQALAYLSVGDSPRDANLDPAEYAAYASVCLAIYNLDEAMTRE